MLVVVPTDLDWLWPLMLLQYLLYLGPVRITDSSLTAFACDVLFLRKGTAGRRQEMIGLNPESQSPHEVLVQ